MDGLFREEAVEASRPRTLGALRLALPVSQQVWGLCAAVTVVAIILWLCLSHYTQREHVSGSLIPEAGVVTVAARGTGIVAWLDVKPGMQVQAGQALLSISGDEASTTLGDTDAAIGKALEEQQAQLRATLAALPQQAASQSVDLRRRVAMLDQQARQIDAQLALQLTEAATADALIRKVQPLLKRKYVCFDLRPFEVGRAQSSHCGSLARFAGHSPGPRSQAKSLMLGSVKCPASGVLS